VDARQVELPLYDTVMEKIGKPIVLNIGMLGAIIALTELVKPESIMATLKERIPGSFLEMNRSALELGMALGNDFNR
jgi:2-oxoglutarate ferredoxin oxidoreductase subunit gamma